MTLSHSKLFNKLDKDSLLWPLYHEMDVPWIMLKVKSWSPTVRVMAIKVWQAWQSAFLTFVSTELYGMTNPVQSKIRILNNLDRCRNN